MIRFLSSFFLLCILFSCSEKKEQPKQTSLPADSPVVKEKLPQVDSTQLYFQRLKELEKQGEIVIDSTNNLVWMRKDFSAINGKFAKNWDEAMNWADTINNNKHLGFNDWHVPSIKEYKTMNRNSGDRKLYRKRFLEIENTYDWGKGAYAFWASNEPSKYVASYTSFHDGFATSGDKNEQKNGITGEDFGMSVRLVRKMNK